jgi:ABC-2 type transport system permease protein
VTYPHAADNSPQLTLLGEFRKIPAFFRRDLLVTWSYRLAFFSDWINLGIQILIFSFVGKVVDSQRLPAFNGTSVSYVEFVAAGIALSSFLQIGLVRIVSVIRQEQLMGTLESLLITPTSPVTIQLGSVIYDLFYIPIRTFVFFSMLALFFDVSFPASSLLPVGVVIIVFVPFVWGLGVLSAAGVLTFRRGSGAVSLWGTLITITSGAYFPISVLPGWLQAVAEYNPVTIALDTVRNAMLAEAGWAEILPTIYVLAPISVVALVLGLVAFRLALDLERRRGTLALY